MSEDQASPAVARIQERLKALGLSERAASIQAFGHPSAIRNMRTGATKDPGIHTLEKLAPVLQAPVEWLAFGVGMASAGASRVKSALEQLYLPVTGEVQAGNWREHDGTIDHAVFDPVPVPADPRWPSEAQYVLITRGNSINRLAKDGDLLHCVDAEATNYEAANGDLVIIERTRFGGAMIERTAKRYYHKNEVFELWPDSDDPDFQKPIVVDPQDAEEGASMRVLAFVPWIHRAATNPEDVRQPGRRSHPTQK